MEHIGSIITLATLLVTGGIAFGKLTQWINQINEKVIALEKMTTNIQTGSQGISVYVTKGECSKFREVCKVGIYDDLAKYQEMFASHSKALHSFENFARWYLSSKEKLSLSEVNKILNGVE